MPSMEEHESHSIVKMLVCGDSGAGKTGALAPLLDAGFNIRALDFDNGLSPIKGYTKDKSKLKNFNYVTCRDNFGFTGDKVTVKKTSGFMEAMQAIDKGTPFGPNIPPLNQWTSRDVLVLDTLSQAGKAALLNVMNLNGRGMGTPQIQDYGSAMESLERLLDMITSDDVKCHVIVNTHTFVAEGTTKMFPEALGSKLPPKVGKVFDNMISLSITQGKRTFKTQKDGLLALKTAAPIKESYPIETGLVDIFRDLTGKTVAELLA